MFNLTLNGAITIEQMVIGVILLLVIFRFSNDVFNLVATLLGFAAFLLPMLGYDLRKLGILSIYMIPFFMSIIGIYIMIGGFRKK
jgi:hypothetical protein